MSHWRAIPQDLLLDPRVAILPPQAQNLLIRLIVFADSHGRLQGHPLTLQHQLMLVGWTPSDTAQHLQALVGAGLVIWYGLSDAQAFVQVVGFDETQPNKLLATRGQSRIDPPSQDHTQGCDLFAQFLQDHHRTTTGTPVEHHRTTTGTPVEHHGAQDKIRENKIRKNSTPIEQIRLAFGQAIKVDNFKLTDKDHKRLLLVLQDHTVDQVVGYLTAAIQHKWFWDEKQGKARRKSAICTLLNRRKDKAGRTYKDKIKGHWPEKSPGQTVAQAQKEADTLAGVWA
tara:strand:- start:121 stop:972 length:852 start_codon:yes stop_codon:yes gene_type:complete